MQIEIETADRSLISDLFSKAEPETGDKVALGEGLEVTLRSIVRSHGIIESGSDILLLVVEIPAAVLAGVLSNWIWDKLKSRNIDSIKIERTEVELTQKKEFVRIVREKVEILCYGSKRHKDND